MSLMLVNTELLMEKIK